MRVIQETATTMELYNNQSRSTILQYRILGLISPLIGISIIIFGNAGLIGLVFGICSMSGLFFWVAPSVVSSTIDKASNKITLRVQRAYQQKEMEVSYDLDRLKVISLHKRRVQLGFYPKQLVWFAADDPPALTELVQRIRTFLPHEVTIL